MKQFVVMNQNGAFLREKMNDAGYGEFTTDVDWVFDLNHATVFRDEPASSLAGCCKMPVAVSVTFDFGSLK